MKVLVTGSLGYIGGVLTPYLEARGHDVVGYDTGFFKDCTLYEPEPARTVLRDARDITGDDLAGVDAIVHLAGISNDPFGNLDAGTVYDPTRAYAVRLATLAKERGIRFVFASSCSIYGVGNDALLDESGPTLPQTPYSLNKLQVEQDLAAMGDTHFSPIALRFATIFGPSPRMRFDIVTNMFAGMAFASKRIIMNSNGAPWRPFLYIEDACEAIRRAIEHDAHAGFLVVNVGDDRNNRRIADVAEKIRDAAPGSEIVFLRDRPELDSEGLVRDGKVQEGIDPRTYRVSFAKISHVFPGFACSWTLERGIGTMLGEFRRIGLTEAHLASTRFYRLQKMDELFRSGRITPELRWSI